MKKITVKPERTGSSAQSHAGVRSGVGLVQFVAERAADELRVEVWNEGPGFTAAERAALFRKFSRVRNAATRDKRGSGLGLYLCAEIAQLHGGRVEAESEPGAWARFTLVLPAPARA